MHILVVINTYATVVVRTFIWVKMKCLRTWNRNCEQTWTVTENIHESCLHLKWSCCCHSSSRWWAVEVLFSEQAQWDYFQVNKIISINIGNRFLSLFSIWPCGGRDGVRRLGHCGEQSGLLFPMVTGSLHIIPYSTHYTYDSTKAGRKKTCNIHLQWFPNLESFDISISVKAGSVKDIPLKKTGVENKNVKEL